MSDVLETKELFRVESVYGYYYSLKVQTYKTKPPFYWKYVSDQHSFPHVNSSSNHVADIINYEKRCIANLENSIKNMDKSNAKVYDGYTQVLKEKKLFLKKLQELREFEKEGFYTLLKKIN